MCCQKFFYLIRPVSKNSFFHLTVYLYFFKSVTLSCPSSSAKFTILFRVFHFFQNIRILNSNQNGYDNVYSADQDLNISGRFRRRPNYFEEFVANNFFTRFWQSSRTLFAFSNTFILCVFYFFQKQSVS